MKQITYEELKKIECRIPDSFDNLFNEICIVNHFCL